MLNNSWAGRNPTTVVVPIEEEEEDTYGSVIICVPCVLHSNSDTLQILMYCNIYWSGGVGSVLDLHVWILFEVKYFLCRP
jgi:hypothetical protein